MSYTDLTQKVVFPVEAWPRFKAALQMIADEPSRLWMPDFVNTSVAEDAWLIEEITRRTGGVPPCGTAACLAGWIGISHKIDTQGKNLADAAREVMKLGQAATYALKALGVSRGSAAGMVFDDGNDGVFYMTEEVKSYADLKAVLEERFVFPEPLPEVRR